MRSAQPGFALTEKGAISASSLNECASLALFVSAALLDSFLHITVKLQVKRAKYLTGTHNGW